MGFDIAGALKAGYSSKEIADHLLNEPGFDVRSARASGYSDDEIIQYLSQAPAAPSYEVPKVDLLNVNPFGSSGVLERPTAREVVAPTVTVAGAPVSQMEGPGPSDSITAMDRLNASQPVRIARGIENTFAGAGQAIFSQFDNETAQGIVQDLGDIYARNEAATGRAMDLTAQEQEANAIEAGASEPGDLQKWWNRADFWGGAGQAAPWAFINPAAGVPGVGGALLRIGGNAAVGGVAGYAAPQENYDPEAASNNAVMGALLGGGISGGVELGMGVRNALQTLRGDTLGNAILESIDPGKLQGTLSALRSTEPPAVRGYKPTAAQAAVAMDNPNLAQLEAEVSRAPGVEGEYLAQRDARALAQADQLTRVRAANASNDPTVAAAVTGAPADAVPTLPLGEVQSAVVAERGAADAAVTTAEGRLAGAATQTKLATEEVGQEVARLRGAIGEASAQRIAAEDARLAESLANIRAQRESALASGDGARSTRLAQEEARVAAEKAALGDEQSAILDGLANRSQSEVGQELQGLAELERTLVRDTITRPAYQRAFEVAGEESVDATSTRAVVGGILGSTDAQLTGELAPQTVSALRRFGLEEQVDAAGNAQLLPAPVSLQEVDAALKAVQVDINQTRSMASSVRDQKLRLLNQIKDALHADLKQFTPEAQQAYREAVDTWKQYYLPRFKTGNINARLFQQNNRNVTAIEPGALVGRYLRSEDSARELVTLFRDRDGMIRPEVAGTLRDGVQDLFRQQMRGGMEGFNVSAANKWLQRNERQLAILEEASPGLRQSIEDAVAAGRRIGQVRTQLETEVSSLRKTLATERTQQTSAANVQARAEAERVRAEVAAGKANVAQETRQQTGSLADLARQRVAQAQQEGLWTRTEALGQQNLAQQQLAEAKRVEKLLSFDDDATMLKAARTKPEVRKELLPRLSPQGRRALAQRMTWDVNNAGTAMERLTYIAENEQALREVFRAADPATADQALLSLRQAAEEALRGEQALAAQSGARSTLEARMNAAGRQIGNTPVEGANLAAYEREKASLLEGATPEELTSLQALELDLARQRRLVQQVQAADPGKSRLEAETQIANTNGIHFFNQAATLVKSILNIVQGRLTRQQAERLARIMLDPQQTADLAESAIRLRQSNAAVEQVVRPATRAAGTAAAQQGAQQ